MVDIETLESFDSFAQVRNQLRAISKGVGEWAGIPVPIEGESLVVDPSYRFASALVEEEKVQQNDDISIKNIFWSTRHRRNVALYEENGKVKKVWMRGVGNLEQQLHTLGCSVAWGIEQEAKALQTLARLVKHHTFKTYLLTGSFLESSPRSGLMYMFRKLRPTVVLSARGDRLRFLCALCMHPVGYYDDSWAGAMTPTDDVIAHLMLMRGDEHMLWKRSNQHPPDRPEAGL